MRDELNRLADRIMRLPVREDTDGGSFCAQVQQRKIADDLRSLAALGAVPETMDTAAVLRCIGDAVGAGTDPVKLRSAIDRALAAACDDIGCGFLSSGNGAPGTASEPAPSAPSPGDALSLDGAASRETADVEALALSAEEIEWLEYAADHMADDTEPEDEQCERVLRSLLARRLSGARQAAMDSDIGPCDPTASTAPLLTAPEPTCASVA